MQTGQNMISSTRKHPETQTIQCHTTTLLHSISRKKKRAKIIQNLKGEVFKRLVMRRQRGWLQQHIQPNQFRLQHHDHLRHASRSFLQVSGIYFQVFAMHLPLIFAGLLDTLKKPCPTMVKGEPQRDSIHLDHAFLHQQVFFFSYAKDIKHIKTSYTFIYHIDNNKAVPNDFDRLNFPGTFSMKNQYLQIGSKPSPAHIPSSLIKRK